MLEIIPINDITIKCSLHPKEKWWRITYREVNICYGYFECINIQIIICVGWFQNSKFEGYNCK